MDYIKIGYICRITMSKSFREIEILDEFVPITLSEMDGVKLMNRTDTKFVFKRDLLNKILPALMDTYKVLEIGGKRLSNYKTLYYDTPIYDFYLNHHNQRGNRFKVRIRNYVESDLYFLEIKNKFKGRTDKKRIAVQDFENELEDRSKEFINKVLGEEVELVSKLWNSFTRITLVNQKEKERLTLDLNLSFEWENNKQLLDEVVIAELKQENVNRASLFYRLLKENGVREKRFSKYCIGIIKQNPEIKSNRFKEKILFIDKLMN